MSVGKDASHELDEEQDIARSAFADMILDEDRNIRYQQALATVIEEKHRNGELANVVDIGTGSGLLSLAAADSGANHVTAVEMFQPVANIAEKIFKRSKFANKIDLVKSRSTDVENHHVLAKGNVIVAEVFDTELIGEGALRTFKEAHGTLVERKSRVIPSSANIWILPVQSSELQKFNRHPRICASSKTLMTCNGLSTAFDFQMSELVPGVDFQPLCKPFIAFSFNFEDPDSIEYNESVMHNFIVDQEFSDASRSFDCVFLWWDLDMAGDGKNIITMAPTWLNPTSSWRDHWMQAAYFMPKPILVKCGENVPLRCIHDEFTFWFNLENRTQETISSMNNCLLHSICARSAFYRMNELEKENGEFMRLLLEFCKDKFVICINEGSLVGLYAAQTASFVAIIDEDPYFNQILQSLALESGFNNLRVLSSLIEIFEENTFQDISAWNNIVILCEPFFLSSTLLPYNFKKLRNRILELANNFTIHFPVGDKVDWKCFLKSTYIKAMPVKFENLWKTVAEIGTTLGFDLSLFNKFYQSARHTSDNAWESHPLWEYPSIATGPPIDVINNEDQNCLDEIILHPEISGTNAVVIWTEVKYWNGLSSTLLLSQGVLNQCKVGEAPLWSRTHRQCVYFLSPAERRQQLEFSDLLGKIPEPIHVSFNW